MGTEVKIEPNSMYGYWRVLEKFSRNPITFSCLCTGCNVTIRNILSYDLRSGRTKSCGCQVGNNHRNTCLERYGVTSTRMLKENEEKRRQTCMEKYGCSNPLQNPSIKQKVRETFLRNHGSLDSQQLLRKKREETIYQRYGVHNPMQSEKIKERHQKAIENKYGVSNPSQLEFVKKKKRQTCLTNYGEEHYRKTEVGKLAFKKTCLEKYGVENPAQSDIVKQIAHPKRRNTNLERYGVEHPTQNAEIALKGVRSRRYRYIKKHWLTSEEIVCLGSYESKVVDFLNNNKINYEWQSKVFNLTTGKTYRPDLYLIDSDLWVEIKGRWLNDAEQKWNEFHTTIHLNSELWDKLKLKEMKIL